MVLNLYGWCEGNEVFIMLSGFVGSRFVMRADRSVLDASCKHRRGCLWGVMLPALSVLCGRRNHAR